MDERAETETDDEQADVLHRALRRFDESAVPQLEMRERSLEARRFVSVPGAQWEGAYGENFENALKLEINKIGRAIRKVETDYRENRIVPDFRPAGGDADDDTAETLDGLLRADMAFYCSQEAYDNAFAEGLRGGMGAVRLVNELADSVDLNSDEQRINPGYLIADADQCVFFDHQARRYDKSDARYAFVITEWSVDGFREEYGEECLTDWPDVANRQIKYDWFRPHKVRVAEYYEREERRETVHVFKQAISRSEERYWSSEITPEAIAEYKANGWEHSTQRRKRFVVRKWVLTGAEVLEGPVRIAGTEIPVVPFYGLREFVDGMERFKGHPHDRMDAQRLYNSAVTRIAEVNATSPGETPIFAPEQMEGAGIREMWANAPRQRPAFLLANPLQDDSGNIVASGPTGTLPAPQVDPTAAALLQIANNDLTEDDVDGADTVKANTSADAMDIAATRVDAKSGIYLDNMARTMKRVAEVYRSMAADVYVENGRKVETMTEDGADGVATLNETYTDGEGIERRRNDFSRGRYKVVASVTEATATRRDKTVRSALNMAEVAIKAGDPDLAKAAILTAIANTDGEGIDELHGYARRKGLEIGLFEPTDDERAALEQANQQPDPNSAAIMAQADALSAQAEKDKAQAMKTQAEVPLIQAKTIETLAKAGAANDPQPVIRRGFEMGDRQAR